MKRIVLAVLLVGGVAVMVSAQGRNRGAAGWPAPGVPVVVAEAVTVSGTLTIVQGSPAIKSGDITYLVSGLLRYSSYIDGLKDGGRVSLEGSAIASPQDPKIKVLRVNKLTIGGKDYDLARPAPAPSTPYMPQPHPGRW